MNKNNATLSKVRSYLSDQKYENEKESKFFKTDRYRWICSFLLGKILKLENSIFVIFNL